MIKKLLLAIALLLPVSAFAQKFGVVNADEVMQSLPAFTEMKTKLEAASKTYEDEFGKLQAEFEKKYTELQGMDDKTPAGWRTEWRERRRPAGSPASAAAAHAAYRGSGHAGSQDRR